MVQQANQKIKTSRQPLAFDVLRPAEAVEREVVALGASLSEAVREAEGLEVSDAASSRRASELMVRMKSALNDAETKRRIAKDPYRKAAEAVDAAFAAATQSVREAYTRVNVRQTNWLADEEDRRQRGLAAQRVAEREAQEAANASAQKAGLAAPVVRPKQAPPEVETHVEVAGGSTTLVRRWTYEVTDEAMLRAFKPELFELSAKRTQALVNSGVRDCPGLRIYQSATTATRA